MKIESISSLQNPKVKNLVKLIEKSSERKSQNLIVVEGLRELGLAISAGMEIEQLYFCADLGANEHELKASQYFEVSREVFAKVAYREKSDGYIALLKPKYYTLETLSLTENPFLIILESVEKPGNLGAILRTADAANIDAVIICDPKTDIYNPNAIRSSVGCIFTVPIVVTTNEEVKSWLIKNNINSYSAALTASKNYTEIDFNKASAIVMGTEATGLSEFWLDSSNVQIKIPMEGKIDSLNVSISTAILTFEAKRQRN
jgi:TrmH family RNA methyltransferase